MNFNMQYFSTLRNKINQELKELMEDKIIDPALGMEQIEKYTWLYGALGKVPSDTMFICENPSFKGIENANIKTVDGRKPDIEAQWWGGEKNPAAKRFRKALYETQLKITSPKEKGGWKCYITNVIKQANIVKNQNALLQCTKEQQARNWAKILQWEITQVKPKHIFCVGGKTERAIKLLQKENRIQKFVINKLMHYSARGTDEKIITEIVSGINKVIKIQT